jgi:hypothetical protein
MSFQTIFEIQQSMTLQYRRTIGQQISRSGQITVAEYLTTVPWVFTVTPHNYLYYPQVRDIIQTIDNYDRQYAQAIQFNSSNLSWFTAMRGTATSATLNGTPAANTQVISLNSNGTFKAGDFIMIGGYTYKIIADSAGSVVGLHRPLIGAQTSGTTVYVGNACTFNMLAETCPTYTLNPMTNGAFVQWDAPFVFRENVTA